MCIFDKATKQKGPVSAAKAVRASGRNEGLVDPAGSSWPEGTSADSASTPNAPEILERCENRRSQQRLYRFDSILICTDSDFP